MALTIDLNSDKIRDQVFGCWMGKNCGGTLGGPLEKAIGEEDPFDVWWYPKLQEGGIPNDDLEMQLVWLKAIEPANRGWLTVVAADRPIELASPIVLAGRGGFAWSGRTDWEH